MYKRQDLDGDDPLKAHGVAEAVAVLDALLAPESPGPIGEHIVREGPDDEDRPVAEASEKGLGPEVDARADDDHADGDDPSLL